MSLDVASRRTAVEPHHDTLSVTRQCELLGISRAAYYYQAVGVSDEDLRRMRILDEVFTKRPYYGSRRLQDELNERGDNIGRDQVRRLMRLMGLEAVYPKPRLSLQNKAHKTYPYLLRQMKIVRPDQVWCSDITYIPLRHGFTYLVAVMDWYSRYVLSWELSMSLESGFCVAALQAALGISTPNIFNTDQGSQFTGEAFTGVLLAGDIRISVDGRGRAFDTRRAGRPEEASVASPKDAKPEAKRNIMIERLWRTVKYEDVYLQDYEHFFMARESLENYFGFYNEERRHSSLGKRTPSAVYWADRRGQEQAV